MQRPKNEGLGAAFGGGMTENLFGAQTTNVLATFTRWLGGVFFILTLTLAVLYAKQSQRRSAIQQELMKSAKPVPAAVSSVAPEAEAGPTPEPMPSSASSPMSLPAVSPASSPAASVAAKPAPSAKPSPKARPSATKAASKKN